MTVFSVHQAKTHLSRILTLFDSGDEVVISRYGKPVVKIVPFEQPQIVRKPGALNTAAAGIFMSASRLPWMT